MERRTERQIMTTAKRFFLIGAFAIAIALPAFAYEDQITHPQLTIVATQKSVLYQDGSIMFNLGLFPANQQRFIYRARNGGATGGSTTYATDEFVGEGSFDEDIGTNALSHFFDPLYNRGLGIPIVCSIYTCEPSWRWMLEPNGDISGQNYSMTDGRNFLYRALTFNDGAATESANARGVAMAQMFLSLGHLQHHMQDMTQPQHVRNDVHYDKFSIPGYSTPSRYEKYTSERHEVIAPYAVGANPVYPGAPAFKLPRDFWTNGSNLGVAQFTNTNFVSYGTNFSFDHGVANANREYMNPLPGASHDYTVGQVFGPVPQELQNLCGLDGVDCTMTMYSTAVEQQASTLSIFDQDLFPRGLRVLYAEPGVPASFYTDRLFALNRFNFDDAHPLLINAAVAYSAGIVNYYFRGKLNVLAPNSGPFAVADHSTNTGFSTLKFNVANNTPGEALSGGTIQAIAHFHRNGCYQPDLSGEFFLSGGQLVTPCPNYRSNESYVRLTAQQSASFGVGATNEMTFNFTEAIPLDATDLIIQVLYRGKVGDEDASFALGALDISEPTYLTLSNATDVFELGANGFFYYPDIIQNIANLPYSIVDIDDNDAYNSPPDVRVTGGPINYQFIINNKKVGDATVPEGRFARIAMLVSTGGFSAEVIAIGVGSFSDDLYAFPSNNAQYDPDSGFYIVTPFDKLRNNQANHFDSVTYWHFFPTTVTPLDQMPVSRASDPTTLVPILITPP
jgi:hypothetical protein